MDIWNSPINDSYINEELKQRLQKVITNKIISKLKVIISDNSQDIVYGTISAPTNFNERVCEAMILNLKQSKQWAEQIQFKELRRSKSLEKLFVPLDFYLTPQSRHLYAEKEERIMFEKALNFANTHCLILGGPGAGKTTMMKFLTLKLIDNPNAFGGNFTCPIVLRLRDAKSNFHELRSTSENLIFVLLEHLGLRISFKKKKKISHKQLEELLLQYYFIAKKMIITFINDFKLIIILDGFDELKNLELKKIYGEEISELTSAIDKGRIIVTSRTGDFEINLSNAETFQISPLDKPQLDKFVYNWLQDDSKSEQLLNHIENSPFKDVSLRPLNVAHLCAIYERYQSIPDQPKDIYRKVVNLLLEDWDTERSIVRDTRYNKFTPERKADFLSRLAFVLTIEVKKVVFSKAALKDIYNLICKDYLLPKNEGFEVIKEIESHSGLLIQSGYDQFEFSHKSLQEFLCASYIARSPFVIDDYEISKNIPNELAIATSISSMPGLFMAKLLIDTMKDRILNLSFLSPFIQRIRMEQPDFEESEYVGLIFAHLYTQLLRNVTNDHKEIKNEQYYVEKWTEKSSHLKLFKELLLIIDSHPNIIASMKKLFDIIEFPKKLMAEMVDFSSGEKRFNNKGIVHFRLKINSKVKFIMYPPVDIDINLDMIKKMLSMPAGK